MEGEKCCGFSSRRRLCVVFSRDRSVRVRRSALAFCCPFPVSSQNELAPGVGSSLAPNRAWPLVLLLLKIANPRLCPDPWWFWASWITSMVWAMFSSRVGSN